MGVMFADYKGKYESDEEIEEDMAPYLGSKRRQTFTALINPAACQRMLQYEREYVERGYGNMYSGLQADPLKGEGAGCSAFGVSFMRVAGLLEGFTKQWQNVIDVPKRFIGGPLTGTKVNIAKILLSPAAKWSSKKAHIHLEAWNPEKMADWVEVVYDRQGLDGYDVTVDRVGDSKTVTVDLTDRAVPTGTFWLN